MPYSGRYYIAVHGFASNTGAFTLSFQIAPEVEDVFANPTFLPANTRLRGVITEADYFYNETLSFTNYGHAYYFDGTSGQTIQIDVFADSLGSEIDPIVYLFDSNGVYLVSDDDGGIDYDSQLVYTLPSSGRYYVIVANLRGAYGTSSTHFYDFCSPIDKQEKIICYAIIAVVKIVKIISFACTVALPARQPPSRPPSYNPPPAVYQGMPQETPIAPPPDVNASQPTSFFKKKGVMAGLIIGLVLLCILLLAVVGFVLVQTGVISLPGGGGDRILIGMPNRDGEADLYLLGLGKDLEKATLVAEDTRLFQPVHLLPSG